MFKYCNIMTALLLVLGSACGPSKAEKNQKRQIEALESEIGKRDRELDERNRREAENEAALAERDQRLVSVEAVLQAKEEEASALQSDKERLNGEIAKQAAQLAELDRTVAAARTDLGRAEEELSSLVGVRDRLQADVDSLTGSLEQRTDELAAAKSALEKVDEAIKAKEAEITDLKGGLTRFGQERVALDRDIAAQRELELKTDEFVLALLGEGADDAREVVLGIQGLWKRPLANAGPGNTCKLFIEVRGLSLRRAVACEKNSTIAVQFGWGALTAADTESEELSEQKLSISEFITTCPEDGYLQGHQILSWRGELPMVINLGVGDQAISDLMQDSHPEGMDCESVAAHPNLPGLELDRAACQLFQAPISAIRAHEMAGCIRQEGTGLLQFHREGTEG